MCLDIVCTGWGTAHSWVHKGSMQAGATVSWWDAVSCAVIRHLYQLYTCWSSCSSC